MEREEAIKILMGYSHTPEERAALEVLIPELAESEDERIRKFLIEILSHGSWRKEWPFGPSEVVAWLEKQKEQKQEWSEEDENAFKYLHELISWGYAEKFMDAQTAHDMRKWVNEHLRPLWKPSEINPEEVRLLDTTISFLKDFADKGYENAVECIDWLKSKRNGTARK